MTSISDIVRAALATLTSVLAEDWPPGFLADDHKKILILGQAWRESRFGSSADWGASNNWGAVTYHLHDGKFISHADHDGAGNPVIYKFQAYDSQHDACKDYLKVLLRNGVPQTLMSGTTRDVAAAMFTNGYYTGVSGTPTQRIDAYTSLIISGAAFISSVLWPPALADDPTARALRDAVRAFQAAHPPLAVDGDPGPLTRAALRAAPGADRNFVETG